MQNGSRRAAANAVTAEGNDTAQPSSTQARIQSSEEPGHKRTGDFLHKSDEDAFTTDRPTEWLSNENLVPAGPYLQYLGQQDGIWLGSALVVLPPTRQNMEDGPVLAYSAGGPAVNVNGRALDEQDGWRFWRFDMTVTMTGEEQAVEYAVDIQDTKFPPKRRVFYVPGVSQPVHWGFHSCNGLSVNADAKAWGQPLLWKDLLNRHSQQHLHVVVGGGDQIYNDGLWKTRPLKEWLDIPKNTERYEHPFTFEMEQTLNSWLLNHYRLHFSHPLLNEAFSIIPQTSQRDDHDEFDGWGSYPEKMQNCPVFQGIHRLCERFYLLFQHHATREGAYETNDMFGTQGCYSFLRMMGPSQAMLVPDTRGERTRHMIMSEEHYNMLFERCAALPPTVRHLVVVFTVPIIYPKLPLSQTVLTTIEGMPLLKGAMTKTGVGAGIIDKFHHVELLDDIEDHWDSTTHIQERNEVIQRFQEHARMHRQRVTYVSGDVHCAQVGRTYTTPKMKHLQHDHRFMPQITSSAIWNAPPPDALLTLLQRLNRAGRIDRHTKEKTVKVFKPLHPKSPKLLGRRNWCEITELPALPADASGRVPRPSGLLEFSLRCEDPSNKGAAPEVYVIPVPTYVPSKSASDTRMTMKTRHWGTCFSRPLELDPIEEF